MNQIIHKISIGMPVFNGEKYIADAMDSILAQTYTHFELIIVDNASSDRTQEICRSRSAKDTRIKYYRNGQNLGQFPNFNRAFELSSGRYFKWASSDDLIAPTFIEKCVEALDRDPRIAVCFSKVKFIDENAKFLQDYNPLPDTSSSLPHIRFRNLILAPHLAVQTGALMRADMIKKTKLFESYPSSDEVFLAHMALFGSYYEIPEYLFFARIHPGQSTKGILASQRARVVFCDTSLEGKTVLVKWLYLKGCIHAIKSAPIKKYERLYCYLQTIHWLLIWKNLKSMGKDVLLAFKQ